MSAGDPLAPDATVLRALRAIHVSPESALPTWDAFQPTTADRAHATERGAPVRVSVWNRAHVSPERARALRNAPDAAVFELAVSHVLAAGERAHAPLAVVEDPDGAAPDLPGATRAAHAGIEGLDRKPGEARVPYRARLQLLANAARRVL